MIILIIPISILVFFQGQLLNHRNISIHPSIRIFVLLVLFSGIEVFNKITCWKLALPIVRSSFGLHCLTVIICAYRSVLLDVSFAVN